MDTAFLMEFRCEGLKDRLPDRDKDGEEVWQLWRIWNKCTQDGQLHYNVEFWEMDRQRVIYTREADEIEDNYPLEAQIWKRKFNNIWARRYRDNGNAIPPDDNNLRSKAQATEGSVSRSVEGWRSTKSLGGRPTTDPTAIYDIPSDTEAEDADHMQGIDGPAGNTPPVPKRIFDGTPNKNPKKKTRLDGQPYRQLASPSHRNPQARSISGIPLIDVDQSGSDDHSEDSDLYDATPPRRYQEEFDITVTPTRQRTSDRPGLVASLAVSSNPSVEKDQSGQPASDGSPSRALSQRSRSNEDGIVKDTPLRPNQEHPRIAQPNTGSEAMATSPGSRRILSSRPNPPAATRHPNGMIRYHNPTPREQPQAIYFTKPIPFGGPTPRRTSDTVCHQTPPADITISPDSGDDDRQIEDLSLTMSETTIENAYNHELEAALDAVFQESQVELMKDRNLAFVPESEFCGSSFLEHSKELVNALEVDIHYLLETILDLKGMPCDKWIERRKTSDGCSFDDLLHCLWLMLLGFDPDILHAFVEGDIPKQAKSNRSLDRKLRLIKNVEKEEYCPSIYAQYLINSLGESPTPATLLKIMDSIELYSKGLGTRDAESESLAAKVDTARPTQNWSMATARKGERRYLKGDKQRNICIQWIKNVRERLKDLEMNKPLDRPLVEVGYATSPTDRLNQHRTHSSSNYLMNLTEAVCKINHPAYKIEQFVLFKLVHVTHAMYAEIISTRMALAYTSQGGGFCHFVAGISHTKAKTPPEGYYYRCQEDLMRDPCFISRVDKDLEAMGQRAELYKKAGKSAAKLDGYIRTAFALSRTVQSRIGESKKIKEEQEQELQGLMDLILQIIQLADRFR